MNKKEIIDSLKGGLIVSCQASIDEPHYIDGVVEMFAKSAQWGGAVAVRIDTPDNVQNVSKVVSIPIIGLHKIDRGIKEVYLTPNIESAKQLFDAGANIIAVQATKHLRDDGKPAYEIISEIKKEIPDALIFADISSPDEAKVAAQKGADFVAPTLQSFSKIDDLDPQKHTFTTNFALLQKVIDAVSEYDCKVIMEGKVNTPQDVIKCLEMGCHAVVVGNAITRPHLNTKRFVEEINKIND